MSNDEYIRRYFQTDVINLIPIIEHFGKYRSYRHNKELNPDQAIVLEVCTIQQYDLAKIQAGLESKKFIELTETQARSLSKTWDGN